MDRAKVGDIIRELRKNEGYSQKELADRLNVAQNTVSNWENESREPDNKTLVKLSKIFSVSTDFLLGKTEIRNPYDSKYVILWYSTIFCTY